MQWAFLQNSFKDNAMKKAILFPLLIALLTPTLFAQTLEDAIRYSNLEVGGTARTVGIGGGIGALGADFSVLSTNPAGLGAFRRSEFVFSPTFERSTVDATLTNEPQNTSSDRQKNNFNFNSLGMVFATQPLDSRWTVSAFGLGLNRMANFHRRSFFEGDSPGSITDRWLEQAQGRTTGDLSDFEAGLAYDAEAIFPVGGLENAYSSDFYEGERVHKTQLIESKGSYNEFVFSFAGNYEDRLMIGATIGVPFVRLEETKTYREADLVDTIPVFNNLTYVERLNTTGAGFNLKLGVIYRFSQAFRVGFAAHTPTSLRLEDTFSTSLNYFYTLDGFTPKGELFSPDGNFQYRLRTPWRLIGSTGFIVKKAGFLSAEIEYLKYTSAKFNFTNATSSDDLDYEQELNNRIDDELASALNIRLGGEFALMDFRFRGGYALYAAPFEAGADDPTGALSVGAGYRGENVYVDMAYRRSMGERNYEPYAVDASPQPVVETEELRNRFMLTFGFKF
jgi:long-subunit fatty acid transport protein